jgi:hypothetical protein
MKENQSKEYQKGWHDGRIDAILELQKELPDLFTKIKKEISEELDKV